MSQMNHLMYVKSVTNNCTQQMDVGTNIMIRILLPPNTLAEVDQWDPRLLTQLTLIHSLVMHHQLKNIFVAPYSSYNPVIYLSFPSAEFAAPEAYLTNYKRLVDYQWYLNSGATYLLTNNMVNMYVREEFKGLKQLVIVNRQGMPITHW